MLWEGFELTIPASEREKTVHVDFQPYCPIIKRGLRENGSYHVSRKALYRFF
jgi:hypothetical protein